MIELPSEFFTHDAQATGFRPEWHVGIPIEEFIHGGNILIEGIRGTGKTHILKMIEYNCLVNFNKLRILPIYVSLAQISEHLRKDPDELRIRLYVHIVQRCVDTVQTHQQLLAPETKWAMKALMRIAALFRITDESSPESIFEQIREIADDLLFELQFNLTGRNLKESLNQSDISKKLLSTGAEAGISGTTLHLDGSFERSRQSDLGTEKQLVYVGRQLAHEDASSFLMQFLKELQILLRLDHTLLLLDECSDAQPKSQVEIFRLFRAIRGTPKALAEAKVCARFIGTVYPRGKTYYPTMEADGLMFEPGQDCNMEYIQLDVADIDSYFNFFRKLTVRRALNSLQIEESSRDIMSDIFDDISTFQLAAVCAHGIPRRYLEILRQAYDPIAMVVQRQGVIAAVQQLVAQRILQLGELREADIALGQYLIRKIDKHNASIRESNKKITQLIQFHRIYMSRCILVLRIGWIV